MDTSYRELKCKDVVNVVDGRNLGRTCDIVFSFPEGQVFGIAVPGKRGGLHIFRKNDLFISIRNIIKIGADVVLVDLRGAHMPPTGGKKHDYCPPPPSGGGAGGGRRDYSEYEAAGAPAPSVRCARHELRARVVGGLRGRLRMRLAGACFMRGILSGRSCAGVPF